MSVAGYLKYVLMDTFQAKDLAASVHLFIVVLGAAQIIKKKIKITQK